MISENDTTLKNQVSASFFIKLFIPFGLSFFMSVLLRTINNVMAPIFIETFEMNASTLGVMTSAYFISFAAAQIPLGICLDRYGPNRTLAAFMMFGVAGCITFGLAQSVLFLFVGRALVGLGVSGCLMSSYKAFGDWMPKNKLPFYNSCVLFLGGIGGIVATAPVGAAIQIMNWRTLYYIFAGMVAVIALLVLFTKRHPRYDGSSATNVIQELRGTLTVATTARFWKLAPAAVITQATYIALNSLWIGPWYKDVAGYPPQAVPNLLLICSISITIGYIFSGSIATWIKVRFKFKAINTMLLTMWTFTIIIALIVAAPGAGHVLWPLFLLLSPFCLLAYPIFISMYDYSLSGRAQTLFNMIVFIISTLIQSGVGWIIDRYPAVDGGGFNPEGYKTALLLIVAINAASLLWCMLYRKKKHEIEY
jgi:MFS family permease